MHVMAPYNANTNFHNGDFRAKRKIGYFEIQFQYLGFPCNFFRFKFS
jgi:hypothetical protein